MLKRKKEKTKEKITILGEGYNLSDPYKKKIQIAIPDSHRKGHFWCFGTTRAGKTRLMESMVEQDIRKGYSVVVIDPKSDIQLFSKIVQVAFEEQRHEDLIFITPIFPEYSAVIDPLAYYYMPEELVAHIVSGVPVEEPFFYKVAYEISMVLVQALLLKAKLEGRGHTFNINEIKDRMSREEIAELLKEIQVIDLPEAKEIAKNMQKIVNSPQDYYSKISTSLRVALMQLSAGNIGKLIGKADENRFIKRLEEGKRVIMIAHLGALLTEDAAKVLGKVIVSMVKTFVGRMFLSGEIINPPIAMYIDEAQNILYYGIEDLFAKAGGAGVWVHAFNQSVNQIYQEVGHEFGRSILDNANTKLFMRVPDTDTAEYVAKHFGTKKRISPAISPGGGIITKEVEEPLVKPEHVLNLGPRQFYLFTYSGQYKGKTIDVSDCYIEIKFPKISVETQEAVAQ
ncbi:MAG: TraM recognition domain-containing protein [Candidatus Methanofastidiosum sp.]|nr:TraM recognition domain-containing protein [Methanofastidiosum sp.]